MAAKWHFLFRDRSLTKFEKLVAAAYASHQNGEQAAAVNKQTIAADCGISVRQVERCKVTLKARGILHQTVVRYGAGTRVREVSVYRILQPQGEFDVPAAERKAEREPYSPSASTQLRIESLQDRDRCNTPDQVSRIEADGNGTTGRIFTQPAFAAGKPSSRETSVSGKSRGEEKPVDNQVKKQSDAGLGATASRDGPDFATGSRILSETSSERSKYKTRAEVRPRAPNSPNIPPGSPPRRPGRPLDDEEQRRRIEARNCRLETEIHQILESSAGLAKDIYRGKWQHCLDQIDARIKAIQPMSAKEFDQRRRLLAEQARRAEKK